MQVLRDIHESAELKLVEAKGKKPGVLAVVEGVFFVAEKSSRNNRIYPRELWERVLKDADLRRLIENRLMFGTVGHEDIDLDALIREQKVSHVVTDLRLTEDGRGIGRAEILDTPVGRILKMLLEGGSKLAVSSKGYGDYKESLGDGTWVVDPSSFMLERFDFVVDPGFLEAQPKLKEVYESVVKGDGKGKDEVVERLVKEKLELEAKLMQLTEELNRLKSEKDRKEVEEEMKGKEASVERDEKVYEKILEREIEKLGDLVVERLGVKEDDITASSLIGVLRKIRKVLGERLDVDGKDRDSMLLENYKKRVRKLREELDRKERLLEKSWKVIKRIDELGGICKVEEALKRSYAVMVALGNQLFKEGVDRLSAEAGVSKEKAGGLIKKHGLKEARELLAKVRKPDKREEKVVITERVVDREERAGLAERLARRIEEIAVRKKSEGIEEIYKGGK